MKFFNLFVNKLCKSNKQAVLVLCVLTRLIVDKGKSVLEGDFCCGHRLKALPYNSMPAFLGFDRQRKIASYKTASHLKKRKIREIFGAEDEARLAPCKDNKPKRAGFFLFSGVLSLSTISQDSIDTVLR